ncbi:MAG: nuclear transport factor 2 family protein [Burkholderiales bacterium]|nr:nuclear transport factor 2 family protein [Burkholderiales bacterium]
MIRFRTLPLALALAAAFGVTACGGTAPTTQSTNERPSMSGQKDQVVALLKSIETGDPAPVAAINPDKYIQHNLGAADGLAGFGALMQLLPKGSARADTVRAFQDGDFVFTHTDYNFFGPKIGFDIFRFENGRIVEHWDNLQEKPAGANPSGHTMTDGPARSQDAAQTEDNKRLVRAFVEDILVNGRMDKLAGYFDGDNYVQHNPKIADRLSGLGDALAAMAKAGVTMSYSRIHRVLGEGNFVLVVSEGDFAGKHSSFYDLFRVKDGKIAEHWDTIETIPPQSEWKNTNGKF